MTEKILITRCKKNDRTAFKELYDQHKRQWFTICLRYMTCRNLSNDMLQNGLIKIFKHITQFDPSKGSFSAWSNKIIVNECLEYLRSQMHKHSMHELNPDSQLMYNGLTPIGQLTAEELTNLIQKLPNGYRSVFNLHAIDGYTHKEIAAKLNISEGTSKSQYFKARKILQKKVEYLINYRAYERI